MSKPLCIYHGNCADGFTAAWAVWKRFGEAYDYYPGVHQQDPPDVEGRDVVIVDFSYKRPVLEEMAQHANSILILDHHKSAQEDLAPFQVTPSTPDGVSQDDVPGMLRDLAELGRPPVIALFDMERSGARIAWDFYHPDEEPPQLLLHVEDRDLWLFALHGTREIQAAVFSYGYSFEIWDWLMLEADPDDLLREGAAIERKHHKDIAELVKVCKRYMEIGGYLVPVASLPYTLTSDAGHLMCEQEEDFGGADDPSLPPFAACYWDTPDGRIFSLRSIDGGEDVSKIATQYGGGGHANAAGFKVSRDHELAQS